MSRRKSILKNRNKKFIKLKNHHGKNHGPIVFGLVRHWMSRWHLYPILPNINPTPPKKSK